MQNLRQHGWVRLHRQIEDWEFYFSEPFTRAQAWIDLFTFANHSDSTFFVRGNEVKVKRGELAWPREQMADRWRWSTGKVDRFLKALEIRRQIILQKTSVVNKIIIVNYEQMQSDNPTDSRQTADRQNFRRNTYKNDKNEKNGKNEHTIEQASDDADSLGVGINRVFQVFYETINKRINFGNKTWRKAAEDLIKEFGLEEVLTLTNVACQLQGQAFAPTITNPLQLKEKMAALQIFIKKTQQPKRGSIQSLL